MNEATEYAENLRNAERFFLKNPKGAFLFAVSNDELVQRNVNSALQQLLRGKGKNIHIHSWDKRPEAPHPLEQLRQVQQAHPQLHGLILNGLDLALDSHPYLVIQLNFAREALLEFGIPLFFWLSSRTLQRVNREAIDLYNQRASANLYFEHDPNLKDSNVSAHRYVAQETTHANASLAHLEARMKLLQQQLDEAEAQQLEPTVIANEIVLELLQVYVKIPGATPLMQVLLDKYGALIDQENPENCFNLAYVFQDMGKIEKAAGLYEVALEKYHQLAGKNPAAYLPNVANTLNNLAILQADKNDHAAAEAAYKEAFAILRQLAAKNPDAYLPGVAIALNNLANLQKAKNDYAAAEASYNEALAVYRSLAGKNPDAYLLDIAMTLNNLANLQKAKNDYVAAEAGYNEALTIRRQLAAQNPDAYQPSVAYTLINMSLLYQELANKEQSLAMVGEALPILLSFADRLPFMRKNLDTALQIVNNWGIDPDEFVKQLSNPA